MKSFEQAMERVYKLRTLWIISFGLQIITTILYILMANQIFLFFTFLFCLVCIIIAVEMIKALNKEERKLIKELRENLKEMEERLR